MALGQRLGPGYFCHLVHSLFGRLVGLRRGIRFLDVIQRFPGFVRVQAGGILPELGELFLQVFSRLVLDDFFLLQRLNLGLQLVHNPADFQ